MDKVNISEKLSLFSDHWNPRVVGRLNGQHVRLAKFQGEVVWHQHDHEDELFLVIRGSFEMQFRDRVETLNEGEFIIVPRRVEHCPRAEEEVQVLLFEPASTLNTGEAESELTVRELGHTVVGCGRSQTGVDELAAEFGKPLTRGVGEKRDGFPAFSQYRAQRRITFGIK
jgi:mannose-6-phosphate isomerase-like protein (cupin superfamily)